MSKKLFLHKEALLIPAALSVPLFFAPLYACDLTDDSGARATPTKYAVEDDRTDTKCDNNLSLVLAQAASVSEKSVFDLMTKDTMYHIFCFLKTVDQNNLALSSKTLYAPARQKLIDEDIRGLKDKEWVNGPKKSTFENYLFNGVIWKMGSVLLQNADDSRKISIINMGPLLKGCFYLGDRFGYLKISQSISEGLVSQEQYIKSESGKAVAKLALSHPKGGEDDFLSLIRYLTPNGEFYALPDHVSNPMGLVERFHRVLLARHAFMMGDAWDVRASQGDFVLKYDLAPITLETIKNTASAHYNAGINFCDLSQKHLSFARSAQLWDTVLDQLGAHAGAIDIKHSADAHYNYAINSRDPSQKLTSFMRAAKLYDATLDQLGIHASLLDIHNAAASYYHVGLTSFNPTQKRASFARAADLYDRLFDLNPDQPIDCLEASVTVYEFIGELDKANDIRARIAILRACAQTS